MQELKRRYSSMYAPQEQEVEEAVLIDRDYKYDGKVIKISKKNFSKVSNDYKNSTKGKERMITYDSKWGTVSVPVEFTEEVEIEEAKEFWAVIDKAKGGEVMAVSSDEKGAKSSVKMSNFSKHDYHFGKDPRTLKIVKVMGSYKKGEKMIGTKLSFKEEVQIDEKGTAYPATIDTLKMIVKDKQHQTVMFKSGQAIVDTFTASAMVAVYDAMKPATKKKFEAMIKDKGGFMKTQAFAMKMTEDVRWNDQIKEDPSLLESLLNEDPDMEKIVKELEGASKMHLAQSKRIQKHLDKMKSEEVEVTESTHGKKGTFTMAPFEDLRGVADVALKIMQGQPQEVKEEEQEVTSEETPQKLTE